MGQPMLPILPPQLDSNDSETEVCPPDCIKMHCIGAVSFVEISSFPTSNSEVGSMRSVWVRLSSVIRPSPNGGKSYTSDSRTGPFREVWLVFMYQDLESVLLIIFRCLSGINLLHVEKKGSSLQTGFTTHSRYSILLFKSFFYSLKLYIYILPFLPSSLTMLPTLNSWVQVISYLSLPSV